MSGNKLRLALVQMHVDAGSPDANFERLEERLAEAVGGGAKPDLIMLPEMWNTGYALEQIGMIADPESERTKALLSRFRAKAWVKIAGRLRRGKAGGRRLQYDLAFDERGELTDDYSKIHLFRLMDEEKYLQAGERLGS